MKGWSQMGVLKQATEFGLLNLLERLITSNYPLGE
jgi:hypothetical protein